MRAAGLLLALWSLTASAFDWNVPQPLQSIEVGDHLQVNGLPLRIIAVRSKLKPDELMTHYVDRFFKEGLYVPREPLKLPGMKLPYLAGLDTISNVSYFMYLFPEPDGTTTLIMGAADLGHRVRRAAGGSGLPIPPTARKVLSSQLEFANTASFETKLSNTELVDFYRQVLPTGGWKERSPGEFVKDRRVVRVMSKAGETPGTLQAVVVEEADESSALSTVLSGSSAAP